MITKKFMQNKAKANACDEDFPLNIMLGMRTKMQRAAMTRPDHIIREGPNSSLVKSRVSSETYRVDLQAAKKGDAHGSCECGFNTVNDALCAHVIAAVQDRNLSLQEHHPRYNSDDWSKTYACPCPWLPSSSEIEAYSHLNDPYLKVPPAHPNRAGAPKKKKRKVPLREKFAKKKRKYTCTKCGQSGHSKANCPNASA